MAAPSIAGIKAAVVAEYGIDPVDLVSARRSRDVAWPRQVAMWLCRRLTTRSLPTIGQQFGGRDHTTVMYACRAVEKRLADPDERATLDRLVRTIGDGAELWPSVAARADWARSAREALQADIDALRLQIEALQHKMDRIAAALNAPHRDEASPATVRSSPASPAFRPPPKPASTPGRDPRVLPNEAPWRCGTAGCRGTRQPGRDRCVSRIAGAQAA